MVKRQPATPAPELPKSHLPFGHEFQRALLRLICEDGGFAFQMGKYLEPHYFENEVLAWAYGFARDYSETYGGMPSLAVIRDSVRHVDQRLHQKYHTVLEQVAQQELKDEQWLRDQTVEFAKRNIFVQAVNESRHLFNAGKIDESYDFMMERMDELHRTTWEPADEELFYAELPRRQNERWKLQGSGGGIPTGFPWLDHVLDGGLSLGEMGIWVAYAKHGKSTLLIQHGIAATKLAHRPTAHFVFEGSRQMVANRYDAALLEELYTNVKRGAIDDSKYSKGWAQYQTMRDLLVIRGFTDKWDYSVVDVHQSLKELERTRGFRPELVVVDYGDLLRGREKRYNSDTDRQKAAFQDLKSLANRGYAIWTASQAQRPLENAENQEHEIKARMIARCWEKVCIGDFCGSINMTLQEREAQQLRLLAEWYRDNEANSVCRMQADLAQMTIREVPGLVSPHGANEVAGPSELGFGRARQVQAVRA